MGNAYGRLDPLAARAGPRVVDDRDAGRAHSVARPGHDGRRPVVADDGRPGRLAGVARLGPRDTPRRTRVAARILAVGPRRRPRRRRPDDGAASPTAGGPVAAPDARGRLRGRS